MEGETRRVEVRIYGEPYIVRAPYTDTAYVEALAAGVDQRMRELARRDPTVGQPRLAVLTALNLADELHKLKEQHRRQLHALQHRLQAVEEVAGSGNGTPAEEVEGADNNG